MPKFTASPDELEFAKLVNQESESISGGQEEKYFGLLNKTQDFLGNAESLFRQGLRGALEGTIELGRLGARSEGAIFKEEQTFPEELKQLLVDENKEKTGLQEFAENVAFRAGKTAPLLAGGEFKGPEIAGRSILSATGGQTAEELGLGPFGQLAAEFPGLAGPNIFEKNIIPKKSQKEFVEFLRNQNLSEEAIAPFLGQERKGSGLFSAFSNRGKRAQESLNLAREGRNTAYSNLRSLPESQIQITPQIQNELFKEVNSHLKQLPVETRNLLKDDLNKFLNSEKNLGDLSILYNSVNFQFPKRGGKTLQNVNRLIEESITKLSPEFGEQFKLTNEVGRKYHQVRDSLKPNVYTDAIKFFQIAKAPIQVAAGVFTGNYPVILEVLGEVAAKEVAREMITNPRLQNLSGKMASAIKNSSPQLARSVWAKTIEEMRNSGIDQETIDKFQDVDVDEFLEAFEQSKDN